MPDINLNIKEIAESVGLVGADKTPEVGFAHLISSLLSATLPIASIMLLLYLVWGGLEWINSGGDKSKIENAQKRMTQAVVGMIILAGAIAIFNFVQYFLGIEVIKFV